MKKQFLLSVMFLFSANCVFCQSPEWLPDEKKGYEIPVGECTWEDLMHGDFFTQYSKNYSSYQPEEVTIRSLNRILTGKLADKHLKTVIVFGAWCGDSEEHLPRFLKVMDDVERIQGYEFDFRLIACDRDKKAGETYIEDLHIERVPTFIFYLDDREIGRIEESPRSSLENDFLDILLNIKD